MGLTAEEFKTLKSKIKAEMSRRNGYGSLSHLAGTAYDFQITPTSDGYVIAEQGQKVIDIALNVTDIPGLVKVVNDDPLPVESLGGLTTAVDNWANESMTGSNSSCRGACSGLCTSSCSGTCGSGCSGCSGCGSSCASTCGANCTGSCSATCTGTCGSNCTASCSAACSTGCGNGCTGCSTGCSITCMTACTTTCTTTCSSQCFGTCTGTSLKIV